MGERAALSLIAGLALQAALAAPAFAQPAPAGDAVPDYRDDRSTPEALIASLYNAVERKEYLRAWSYFREEPGRPDAETFAAGYADTAHVRVRTGTGTSEGAAGSIFFSLPAVVEATGTDGAPTVYAGCYELRLVQPVNQIEPPFRPLGIVAAELKEVSASFEAAEGDCPEEGL
ncbi:hypothetical protein [Aureimonas populi]|uniref:DUF1176 domain-containing protein n=1 Tax=Aureimonas populi TaxID=1701758 RepID=A0ABW5CQV8_9HYPH|nr:hypothetical protein [Aureimonas populi]